MCTILRLAHTDSQIILEANDESLRIQAYNPANASNLDFYVPLLPSVSESMVIPSFNLDSVIELKSREFSVMCKELSNISESVIVKTEPD